MITENNKTKLNSRTTLPTTNQPNYDDIADYIAFNDENSENETVNFTDKTPNKKLFLETKEIDEQKVDIYEKTRLNYNRKSTSQYAMAWGNDINEDDTNEEKNIKEMLHQTNKNLCSCGKDFGYTNTEKLIKFVSNNGVRKFEGTKSCSSINSCPVCASKIAHTRGSELKEMLEVGKKNGRSYMMFVTTIPHQPGEKLDDLTQTVSDMSTYIMSSRKFKDFKKKISCRFVHSGFEVMVSTKKNRIDWNAHRNYLTDSDISSEEVLSRMNMKSSIELRLYLSRLLTSIGQKYLDKNNIKKKLLKPYIQTEKSGKINIKGGVSVSTEFDEAYISKWGLGEEMTQGVQKDGKVTGSMHPFGLLDLIRNEDTPKHIKTRSILAYREFVFTTKGKKWFLFGRGAIPYYNENYNAKIRDKDEEIGDEEPETLMVLDENEWLRWFQPTAEKIGRALTFETDDECVEYIQSEIQKGYEMLGNDDYFEKYEKYEEYEE